MKPTTDRAVVDAGVDADRRRAAIGVPLVLFTVLSRTVWARSLQQQQSTCASCVPSGTAAGVRLPAGKHLL